MKIARGSTPSGEIVWAKVEEKEGLPPRYLSLEFDRENSPASPLSCLGTERFSVGREIEFSQLLSPLDPSLMLCVGLNYRAHAEALGFKAPEHPLIIPKWLNALSGPYDAIELPRHLRSDQVDYEGELAVIIGRRAKNVARREALDFVLGYCCANDVTARDWQFQWGGGQWSRGKGFDTFAPLGPYLVTKSSVPDPQNLKIETRVNGEIRQKNNTSEMIFSIAQLIEFLSGSTTLHPGTVILTGTPDGVGMKRKPPTWLQEGDLVEVDIESIGCLRNRVEREPGSF